MIRQIIIKKENSAVEKYFWNLLKNRELTGCRFLRQHSLGKYIVDFYCDELKLAIELDAENYTCKNKYDLERECYIKSLGIKLVRISSGDLKTALKYFMELLINNKTKQEYNIL